MLASPAGSAGLRRTPAQTRAPSRLHARPSGCRRVHWGADWMCGRCQVKGGGGGSSSSSSSSKRSTSTPSLPCWLKSISPGNELHNLALLVHAHGHHLVGAALPAAAARQRRGRHSVACMAAIGARGGWTQTSQGMMACLEVHALQPGTTKCACPAHSPVVQMVDKHPSARGARHLCHRV